MCRRGRGDDKKVRHLLFLGEGDPEGNLVQTRRGLHVALVEGKAGAWGCPGGRLAEATGEPLWRVSKPL